MSNPERIELEKALAGLGEAAELGKIAEESKEKLANSGKFKGAIVTEILPGMKFWPAEDYHQKYYRKNPEHFDAFEQGSGRVSFEKKNWGEKK